MTQKTILITGATDGIGFETAKKLASEGHNLLLHGRNEAKLEQSEKEIGALMSKGQLRSYKADLSDLHDVDALARSVRADIDILDVIINNAGVLKTPQTTTKYGIDVRFVVNTIAPYMLTKILLPVLSETGRVVNLSSAAQSPVNMKALIGEVDALQDMDAYAQSKLAITMWTRSLAKSMPKQGQVAVAVNPGSLLASKMVKEGFGVAGSDIGIGADIITRAALSDEFIGMSGAYYDNDNACFAEPHSAGLNNDSCDELVRAIERTLSSQGI